MDVIPKTPLVEKLFHSMELSNESIEMLEKSIPVEIQNDISKLDSQTITQMGDVLLYIHVAQNIRKEGVLRNNCSNQESVDILKSMGLIRRNEWKPFKLDELLVTTPLGGKICQLIFHDLVRKETLSNFHPITYLIFSEILETERFGILPTKFFGNRYISRYHSIDEFFLAEVPESNILAFEECEKICKLFLSKGLCAVANSYVGTDGGRIDDQYYVLAPVLSDALIKSSKNANPTFIKKINDLYTNIQKKALALEFLSSYNHDKYNGLGKFKASHENIILYFEKLKDCVKTYRNIKELTAFSIAPPFIIEDKTLYDEKIDEFYGELNDEIDIELTKIIKEFSSNEIKVMPEININTLPPIENASIQISGNSRHPKGIESVTVNGEYAGAETWSRKIPLKEGDNTIAIIAKSKTGEEKSKQIFIRYIIEPPPLKDTSEIIFVGSKELPKQWGILGIVDGKKVAIDLNEPHTISIFGVQRSGKSYTLGVVTEMAVKPIENLSKLGKPMACVIFHYSKNESYAPEFESFRRTNNNAEEIKNLEQQYRAKPSKIDTLTILVPPTKLELRKKEYNTTVEPLLFRPQDLGALEWKTLLCAGERQIYLKMIKKILETLKNEQRLTIQGLKDEINKSDLNSQQKKLSLLRIDFIEKFLNENAKPFSEFLIPGTITLLDIRDEMLDEQEASTILGMLLIAMGKIDQDKLLVIDEAHKYFGKALEKDIVELIREMAHTRTRILIASQDPPSVNPRVIELSDIIMLHQMSSPEWLKHIQGKNNALKKLTIDELSSLSKGEAYIWAKRSTDTEISIIPKKIQIRPRATEHGGVTKIAFQ